MGHTHSLNMTRSLAVPGVWQVVVTFGWQKAESFGPAQRPIGDRFNRLDWSLVASFEMAMAAFGHVRVHLCCSIKPERLRDHLAAADDLPPRQRLGKPKLGHF